MSRAACALIAALWLAGCAAAETGFTPRLFWDGHRLEVPPITFLTIRF